MKSILTTVIVLLAFVGLCCAAAPDPEGDDTGFQTMPPERVLALLRQPGRVELSDQDQTSLKAFPPEWMLSCKNGTDVRYCAALALRSSHLNLPLAIKLTMIGCSYEAIPGHQHVGNWPLLGVLLRKAGNVEAARAIEQHAPPMHEMAGAMRDIFALAQQTPTPAADQGGQAVANQPATGDSGQLANNLPVPASAGSPDSRMQNTADLEQAANAGDVRAQVELGNRYSAGKDLPKDDNQALAWWKKAADQGSVAAMVRLSGYYLGKDPARSNEWQQKAAELGDPMSEQNLGQEYEDARDYKQAAYWYQQGVKNGLKLSVYGAVRVAAKTYRPGSERASWPPDPETAARTGSPLSLPSPTDPRIMPGAYVLTLLKSAAELKVDPKGTLFATDRSDRDLKSDLKACNGGKVSAGAIGTIACLNIFTAHRELDTSQSLSSTDRFYILSTLLRGCGVYALSSDNYEAMDGRACGILGRYLWELGNHEAAKVVWEAAPGCYSVDHRAGTPVSACVAAILGEHLSSVFTSNFDPYVAYKFQPERLVQLMWKSCTTVHDRNSCEFLSSNGANVDMAAVEQAENDRHDAIEENRERNREEFARAQADSEARRDALFGALQSMGGGDPNLIANTANQQAAAIRAIGDANAARQQASQQMAAQRGASATNQAAPSTASQAYANGAESAQAAPPSTTAATDSTAIPAQLVEGLPSSCINQFWDRQNYSWLSFQNTCSQPVYVTFIFNNPSGWALSGGNSMNLAPGAHKTTGLTGTEINQAGGFQYYVCPANTLPVDLNGNTFTSNVSAYRCKSQ
jgi:hypothetical protein